MACPAGGKERSRLSQLIMDTVIVVAISGGLLVIGEVFLKAFFPQKTVARSLSGERFSERDQVLGIRYIAGAIWHFSHPEYEVEYRINENGFRDAKVHPTPKPDGTTRVLVLGDSFTFGQSVNYEQTWSVIVEKRMEESGNNHIDLVKAGMQGMDTRSELILMQRLFEKDDYDVVVVGFAINDLYTNSLHGFTGGEEKLTPDRVDQQLSERQSRAGASWDETAKQVFVDAGRRSRSSHLLTLAQRIAIASNAVYCKLYFGAPDRGKFLTFPLSPAPKEKLKITQMLLEKMADYLHGREKRFIVLSIPQQSQVLCSEDGMISDTIDFTFYDRYFSNLGDENGFSWVTTLNDFNKFIHKKDKLFYRLDGHLTPAGNEVLAEVFLREVVPLINEGKSDLKLLSGGKPGL